MITIYFFLFVCVCGGGGGGELGIFLRGRVGELLPLNTLDSTLEADKKCTSMYNTIRAEPSH